MSPNTPDADLESLLHQLDDLQSYEENCFLCGKSLLAGDYTHEHVIPRWAQNRYELWNQQFILLNRTSIPYRQWTVPCCDQGTNYRLKPIEDSLAQTVERGRDAVMSLGHKILFLWLGKIFYGILYNELSLVVDRKDPQGITIITPEFLERYRRHRFSSNKLVKPSNL